MVNVPGISVSFYHKLHELVHTFNADQQISFTEVAFVENDTNNISKMPHRFSTMDQVDRYNVMTYIVMTFCLSELLSSS